VRNWSIRTPRRSQRNNGGKTDDRYQQGEDTLNAWLSGALAYTRIMEKAGDRVEAAKGKVATAEYLADRVWLEKADRTFVVGLRHWAKLARYRNTTWDTTRLLAEATDGKLAENVRTLTCQAPSWHHAWGDLLVGGENFTHSPQLARGLFLALADGNIADNKELTRFLDVPTCRADLYWIEKLSAMLRRVDR